MRKFTKPDLPREHERQFWRGIRVGLSVDEAALAAGASWSWARRLFVKAGGVNLATNAEPAGRRYLRFQEREEIMRLQASGLGVCAIAREIGRHPSTISRELKRAVGTRGYRASMAQTHADRGRRGPRGAKLATNLRLRRVRDAAPPSRWARPKEASDVVVERLTHRRLHEGLGPAQLAEAQFLSAPKKFLVLAFDSVEQMPRSPIRIGVVTVTDSQIPPK